jgi:hypothetical protein
MGNGWDSGWATDGQRIGNGLATDGITDWQRIDSGWDGTVGCVSGTEWNVTHHQRMWAADVGNGIVDYFILK